MSKLFTSITGIVLLVVAGVHAYRLLHPFDIIVAGHSIPVMYSWPAAVVAALLALMILVEARR